MNATATGANDGTSWADAFVSLQSALEVAQAGDQIWVAAGVYKPTAREDPGDPRSATFRLLSGVKVYGGFAGTETMLSQRQIDVNVTTLSGDLAGDDGPDFSNYGENVYHVLRADGTDTLARLDGFTVSGGNATRPSNPMDHGGGLLIWIEPGFLTVAHCVFVRNRAIVGGGIEIESGNPTLYRCTFAENVADGGWGGGVSCNDDMHSAPLILNCRFLRNRARRGGGLATGENGAPFLMNCIFSGNEAEQYGGGLSGFDVLMRVVNCTFNNNYAKLRAGGASAFYGRNCIFWANTAGTATGIAVQVESAQLSNSCIQGLSGPPIGNGNLGLDPQFVDALGPDGIAGTLDDDLRLSSGSPCVDNGSNRAFCGIPADEHYGPFCNQCDFIADLDGADRYVDDVNTPDCVPPAVDCGAQPAIDMGAYEYRAAPAPRPPHRRFELRRYGQPGRCAGVCAGRHRPHSVLRDVSHVPPFERRHKRRRHS